MKRSAQRRGTGMSFSARTRLTASRRTATRKLPPEFAISSSAICIRASSSPQYFGPNTRWRPAIRAFSLMSPMVMAMLFREVFGGVGANPPDLQALADQHARTAPRGR